MLIHLFQWPTEVGAYPGASVSMVRFEEGARAEARAIALSDRGLELLAERLIDLAGSTVLGGLAGRLRVVVAWDQGLDSTGTRRGGARVRMTWTNHELERRRDEDRRRAEAAREAAYHAEGPARAIASQLPVSADDVRRGTVVRVREGEAPQSVAGNARARLAELIDTRMEGDRFYFIPQRGDVPYPIGTFSAFKYQEDPLAELPGTMAHAIRIANERRAAAVDRLLRIMLAIAEAAARARAGAELWLQVTTAILRAWSSAPTLLELDVDRAPFGVDLEAPADPIAVRVGLLELDR